MSTKKALAEKGITHHPSKLKSNVKIGAKTKLKGWRKKLTPSFINSFFTRASQRTCRFIRRLRDGLYKGLSYKQSLIELAYAWECEAP